MTAVSSPSKPVQEESAWPARRELLGQVWHLALPVILTNFLQSLTDVVDVFMVGRLGPIAIAAVGMSSAIRMLVLVMLLSVAAGAMTLVAQAKGARDPERMSFVVRQAISSGVLMSLALTVAGLFLARPLLTLVNGSGEVEAVELGVEYLQIIFLGTPFLVMNIVFNRLMQGAGDTVTPLVLTGVLNLLNVIISYLFMFGPGPFPAMGASGAALGTVISRALAVIVVFWLIYSGKNVIKLLPGSYKPNWQMFSDIFSIGIPSGMQGLFRNGSRLLVMGIITATEAGTYGAAALAIGFQVETLIFMPGLALNVAATTLVGQALGYWQPQEARRRGNTAIVLGLVIMVVLAIPIIVFAPAIIRLFDPSAHPTLLRVGLSYFYINTVVLPLSAVGLVANGALRGAGDSMPGMISTALTRAFVSVVLAYVLAFPMGMGSTGVWIALAIGTILDALYMGLRWQGKAWLQVALHKTEVYRSYLRHLPEAIQQQYLLEIRSPFMAQPGAREHVDEQGVLYRLPEGDVRVRFDKDHYQTVAH